MAHSSHLDSRLKTLDGKPYGALKQLTGLWEFEGFDLYIDKVQSDPYAPPSKIRLEIPWASTSLPPEMIVSSADRITLADFLARDISDAIVHGPREYFFVTPGQEILPRSSVRVFEDSIRICLTFQFPAAGRRVKGHRAAHLLVDELPQLLQFSALGERFDLQGLQTHLDTYRDFLYLQENLARHDLVAFVANNAVLPRASGNSDTPLASAVPLSAPADLEVGFTLPSGKKVTGMGIPAGITLLVGGGFHGKSTLLRAIERSVYAHIPGDGRELVVCDPAALTIRAEDGRAVTGTNISAVINNLPGGIDTQAFSTTNASGSTSQAANLSEALEMGAQTLLIDEDTSATNFMIRDQRMKELVTSEPIRPFEEIVSDLWEEKGISTIMVMGGSGAFFDRAHTVLALENFLPRLVTEQAHSIAQRWSEKTSPHRPAPGFQQGTHPSIQSLGTARSISPSSLLPADSHKPARARGRETIQLGREELDLRCLSQLVDAGQTQTIALCLAEVAHQLKKKPSSLAEAVRGVIYQLESHGLEALTGTGSGLRGDLALPRAFELHQAISRWRGLRSAPQDLGRELT